MIHRPKETGIVVLLTILVIVLTVSCPGSSYSDGMVTIRIENASAFEGATCYILFQSCDSAFSTEGEAIITDGIAEYLVKASSTDNPQIFSGGGCYFTEILIDVDGSAGKTNEIDYISSVQKDIFVDGNITVTYHCLDDFDLLDDENCTPELSIYYGDQWLGSSIDLGSVLINSPMEYTFTIENDGYSDLNLSGTPIVELSGSNSDYLTLTAYPDSVLSPDDSTYFTVELNASAEAELAVTVSIPCNCGGSSPYEFTINSKAVDPPGKLPKTGQTTSYATGDDGDLERGIVWPGTRYVDNADGTFTDMLTGLMWESTPSSTLRDWEAAILYANNLTLASYTDWHLANVNELLSVSDLETTVNTTRDYWSSNLSYSSSYTQYGWVVQWKQKILKRETPINFATNYAWAVRETGSGSIAVAKTGMTSKYRDGDDGDLQSGIAWPSPRFSTLADGLVLDLLTGLIWMNAPLQTSGTWQTALTYANTLSYGGYSDWRLPNRNEMRSLISYGTTSNDTRLTSIFNATVPSGYYWTSSTFAEDTDDAWIISLETGHTFNEVKTNTGPYCWACRGGD